MNIKKLPMEERPVERALTSGIKVLTNAELLALIIKTGTQKESAIALSERVLSNMDNGIRGLAGITPQELMEIPGVGKSKACALVAVGELAKRLGGTSVMEVQEVTCAEDVAKIFMNDLRFEKKEHFKTVLLNTKGKIIHIDQVSIGDLSTAPVHPREVFSSAIKRSASAMILVHNHPSGDPTPSGEDLALTERIKRAGELLGIRILDHIVIGDGDYYSFAGNGNL